MLLLSLLAAGSLYAQEIRTTVPLVLAPISVTDKRGKPVAGLNETDFLLHDAGKLRAHQLEVTVQPISVVVCIQSNTAAGPALAKLVKVGSLVLPLIAGEYGSAALVTYSSSVKVRQDFTNDAMALTRAFTAIRPDGHISQQIDAISTALRMLEQRDPRHRKVILVFGETKDRGSETSLEQVLRQAARSNVIIYPVSFSAFFTSFTSRGEEHFGNKNDPKQPRVYEPGQGNILTGIGELIRLGKTSTAEALATATGGERLSFARLKGLEEMVQKVGDDLHNQYLVSFTPTSGEPGYREIKVQVKDRPELAVRARPGYWYTQP